MIDSVDEIEKIASLFENEGNHPLNTYIQNLKTYLESMEPHRLILVDPVLPAEHKKSKYIGNAFLGNSSILAYLSKELTDHDTSNIVFLSPIPFPQLAKIEDNKPQYVVPFEDYPKTIFQVELFDVDKAYKIYHSKKARKGRTIDEIMSELKPKIQKSHTLCEQSLSYVLEQFKFNDYKRSETGKNLVSLYMNKKSVCVPIIKRACKTTGVSYEFIGDGINQNGMGGGTKSHSSIARLQGYIPYKQKEEFQLDFNLKVNP